MTTAFEKTWRAHWQYSAGHPIGNAPKLIEAVELFEAETRAREALRARAMRDEAEAKKHSGSKLVARGK